MLMTLYDLPKEILFNLNCVLTGHVLRRRFDNTLIISLSLFIAKVFSTAQFKPRVPSLSSRNRSLLNNILIVRSSGVAQRPFSRLILFLSEKTHPKYMSALSRSAPLHFNLRLPVLHNLLKHIHGRMILTITMAKIQE